jgi:hydroxyacylglutathione hydrolase
VLQSGLQLGVIVDAFYAENTYIAHRPGRAECVVVDPGFDFDGVLAHLDKQGLTPAAILNTHGHVDHIVGNQAIKKRWPEIPLVIGAGDAYKLTDPAGNLSRTGGVEIVSPPADRQLVEGERIEYAGIELEVFETPGHSAGHIIFLWRGDSPWVVIGGDVLFQGGVGRTDFPDGNFDDLATSIRTKIYTLSDETVVLPGHGAPTTVGEEKRNNPFVKG